MRGVAFVLATLMLVLVALVACSASALDEYFGESNPVLDDHSETMSNAETSMFEVSKLNAGSGLAFGADSLSAALLLPIFRATGDAVEAHMAAWDEIDPPGEAEEYHSLVRVVMELRLSAMREGAETLATIAAGQTELGDPFTGPEAAMEDANAVLLRALQEAELVRN